MPNALGKDDDVRKANLAGLMDGYFHHEASIEGGQHLNVNVMNREMLLDAMETLRIPSADHPRFRLRRALQLADQRATAGRHYSYLHSNDVIRQPGGKPPGAKVRAGSAGPFSHRLP